MDAQKSPQAICPICGKNNQCGAQTGQCWCFSLKIDKETIDKIPEAFKNTSCICQACAEAKTPQK